MLIHDPPAREELEQRAARAREALRCCHLCERRCGVNRLAGERAPCGLDDETWCFKRHLSLAEEDELLPSYMVYLGACNLRCQFCVQGPTCFEPRAGFRVDPALTAADLERALDRGARSINLLGGEPGLHPHTILEIAARARRRLPLVLNSNMYMTPVVFDLLDGVVTLYLGDFKFGNDACATRLAGVERYVPVVTRNLLRAADRARLLVRHLVMPGHVDCCLRPVTQWMAAHLPEVPFSLHTGYVPAFRAGALPGMDRCLTARERSAARDIVARAGVRLVEARATGPTPVPLSIGGAAGAATCP